MKRLFFTLLVLATCTNLFAQEPYVAVAQYILQNNADVQVMHLHCMADSAEAVSGSLFDNPEVEFAYYAGSPSAVGVRWDLSVVQPLRMPNYYISHQAHRKLKQQEAQLDMDMGRRTLQTRIELLCSDIVLLNALYLHYGECEGKARTLCGAYKQRLDEGSCTVIEYNSIMVSQSQIHGRLMEVDVQRREKMSQLCMLNGGRPISFEQDTFAVVVLPANIERYADSMVSHSIFEAHRTNADKQHANQVDIARNEWLPSFGVGYASENTMGETFRGCVMKLCLPLWHNARQVGGAKLASMAAAAKHLNDQTVERQQLLLYYNNATRLKKSIATLQQSLSTYDSETLLYTALQAGEITVQQYLQQWEEFHDAQIAILELKHQLDQASILLYSMEQCK